MGWGGLHCILLPSRTQVDLTARFVVLIWAFAQPQRYFRNAIIVCDWLVVGLSSHCVQVFVQTRWTQPSGGEFRCVHKYQDTVRSFLGSNRSGHSTFYPEISNMRAVASAFCIAAFTSLTAADAASDLSATLSEYPRLSNLKALVDTLPGVVNSVIGDKQQITILAPSNAALAAYATSNNGVELFNSSREILTNILSYHILASNIVSNNFSTSKGLTAPSLLKGQLFNNRTAGPEFIQSFGVDANGQVIFAAPGLNAGQYTLQAAQTENVNLTALDRRWARGTLQMVDTVLNLPKNCTSTMETQPSLKSLVASLKGTAVYDTIDTLANVTCLAPNDDAFVAAGGDPRKNGKLNETEYQWLIQRHVINQPIYFDRLRDGMELKSLRNTTVKVSLKAGEIFFNNAKVVKSNVM